MKRILALFGLVLMALTGAGCGAATPPARIAATTLPVYNFTQRLCQNTGISVTRLITENVSCLHEYSLSVQQVKAVEAAEMVVISGGGLEDFMMDVLSKSTRVIDSSENIALLHCKEEHDHTHTHEADPHLWLSPEYAMSMVTNICRELQMAYPSHHAIFEENLNSLLSDLRALENYGKEQLSQLSCRELITFHDGFAYFADAFDLTILKAVEEESGSEASAAELKELIGLVQAHQLPAIFTEKSGSVSAANILCAETNAKAFSLDMAMSGSSYFDAMYANINTVKEALG